MNPQPFAWSDEQEKIVHAPPGACVVVAGAGTGKTETLTGRVLQLLLDGAPEADGQAEPCELHQIVALTFTDKAASEMRGRIYKGLVERLRAETNAAKRARLERLRDEWGTSNRIGTFDAWTRKILDVFPEAALGVAGVPPGFETTAGADERELHTLLSRAFWERCEGLEGESREDLFDLLSRYDRALLLRLVADLAREENATLEQLSLSAPAAEVREEIGILCAEARERHDRRATRQADKLWQRAQAALPEDLPTPLRLALEDRAMVADRVLTYTGTWRRDFARNWPPEALERAEVVLPAFKRWRDALADARKERELLDLSDEAVALEVESRGVVRKLASLARDWKAARVTLTAQERKLAFDEISHAASLILRDPQLAQRVRAGCKWVLIDEFQDTNDAQWSLIEALKVPNVLIVGDEKQCVPSGTPVLTQEGEVPAECVQVGMTLLAACSSRLYPVKVSEVFSRHVEEQVMITLTTREGRMITTTPSHMHFAGYVLEDAQSERPLHLVYLMLREGTGFRIGVTRQTRHTNGRANHGWKGRLNQERGDLLWLLGAYETETEARFHEQLWSVKYGLPTWLFHDGSGRNTAYDGVWIERLYREVDTASGAARLLADRAMFEQYPHHTPKCSIRRRRRNFSITMCSHYSCGALHRYAISGSEEQDAERLREIGLPVRGAKGGGWRLECVSSDLRRVYALVERVRSVMEINVIEKAHFTANSLPFTPASHVLPGMSLFVRDGETVVMDKVASIERTTYTGTVWDFNVPRFHNYVAGGIVTHNSIYAFRQGDITVFDRVRRQLLDGGEPLELTTSRRSTPAIVAWCNRVFHELLPDAGESEEYEAPFLALQPAPGDIRTGQVHLLHPLSPQESDEEDERTRGAQAIAKFLRALQDDADEGESTRLPQFAGTTEKLRAGEAGTIGVLFRTHERKAACEAALDDAGVRYASVKGIGFWQSEAARDALNLAAWLAEPRDDLALVGILRSPFGGLSDLALLHLRARNLNTPLWEVINEGPPLTFPADEREVLALVTERLTRWLRLARVRPLSEVLETARRESEAAFYEAGWADAAQRAANWGKLADEIRAREDAGRGSPREIATYLRGQESLETREPDAPLPDSGAIQLMTVYAAKGLGFPLTLVAQTDDTPRQPPLTLRRGLFPDRETVQISARVEGEGGERLLPPLWHVLASEEKARDNAEWLRLLYVACTRARDELVVLLPHGRREGTWAELLAPFCEGLPDCNVRAD